MKVSPTQLTGARELFGREQDLAWLDAALGGVGVNVATIVAWGGVGKTALVNEWRNRLLMGRHELEYVFDWSFFSQGVRERGAVSADDFLREALRFFGDPELAESNASPLDKGTRLAELVGGCRSLLILDGLEPLQHPPPRAGESGALKEGSIANLLKGLAARNLGLCVVTTREAVLELEGFESTTARRRQLAHLSLEAGAGLLRSLLEDGGGPKPVKSTVAEREEISKVVKGHALTLQLLGSYIRRALGYVRGWKEIDFERADAEVQGRHAFRVMDAYVWWLSGEAPRRGQGWVAWVRSVFRRPRPAGLQGQRQLAVLRLLGLFDRPADPACVVALRRYPVIPGITEALEGVDAQGWRLLVSSLEDMRLVMSSEYEPLQVRGYSEEAAKLAGEEGAPAGEPKVWRSRELGPDALVLDAHPLVREYFARELQETNATGWRVGHQRLYEHLCGSVPYWPEGVEGLQPLYQAVAHGCAAGRVREARAAVYRGRILRGARFYSTKQLGTFSANLAAVACLFERMWDRPSTDLAEADRAWVLGEAAFSLRALGRLSEALEPMRAGLEMRVELEGWKNASIAAGNLSELELTLGHTRAAVNDAQQAVDLAERSGDDFQRMSKRTTLADARLQAGEHAGARELFEQAESMLAQYQPSYPQLYSLWGYRYCDLLLCPAERAAWRGSSGDATNDVEFIPLCAEVFARATRALAWGNRGRSSLLDIALDHLTLGRSALYAASLRARAPAATTESELSFTSAREHLDAAVDGLRNAGHQDHLPGGLLTRAWLHHHDNHPERARADLDEAWTIAERGPMPLFQADIQLHRARIFHDRTALAAARELITRHEYNRRLPELEDAEQAAQSWPDPTPDPDPQPPSTPPTTKLRILHISDIHFRASTTPGARAEQIKRETPKRARVIAGPAWRDNLTAILDDGPIDLVCLTGDIADYGKAEEFEQGTRFVDDLLRALDLPRSRLFVVPGNHDIDRGKKGEITNASTAWKGIREQPWTTRAELSDWMAGAKPPPGVEEDWRDHVRERQAAFWSWVEHDLGRPELLPARSRHERLGYRVDVSEELGLSTPLWILGLDTAWLAGDEHDAGKLLLTKDQLLLLGTAEDGHELPGFRLALGHHPLGELADATQARQLLADYADVYLHGHQHEPLSIRSIDPDRHSLELAAGCLFEGTRKDEHANGFAVITLDLDDRGRPQRAELRFRSWSPRGGHWHDDSSIYKEATQGRLTIEWPPAKQ